ncbi:MAG: hypothetical protein RLZZ543_33 [Bacteroidota bacterium]|jgi:uncharacterized membrane protein YfcA
MMSKKPPMDISILIVLLLVGLFAGIASGLVGIGGGIIIVPALAYFLSMTQHQAQGVSIGMLLMPVGFLAAYNYYKAGNLNFKYSLIIGLTFIAGAWIGSKISLTIDENVMRKIFGVFVLLMALKMIFSK